MAERVRLGWTRLAAILAEPNIRDLILAYNEELNPIPEVAAIDPDWDELIRREAAGIYRVWTAYAGGTLAGFITFHVHPHLNFRQTLFAVDSGHFIAPAFRDTSRIGYRMWRAAEPALRDLGVAVILAHDNALRPLLPLFLALGYEPRSTLFMKVIA